ncbi:DUF4129 domain-containing transglutaminase family protein [Bacillus kwashiorkori]|uniref:DUF4129 domain-containing transglutaminase family protein n=1 Tax=Bacillus kwashiorkori TaxID=1522318 RepID=UPI0007803C3F|nr:transglutaminase domain-containing protein [Bacillus kwashiorkori]
MTTIKTRSVESFILHFIGFMLLWEWLRPITHFGDVSRVGVFLFFLALSFLLNYLNVKWYISFTIKTFYIVVVLNIFYLQISFFKLNFLLELWKDFIFNIRAMIQADWMSMTDLFRTSIFFVLIWSLVYLFCYWLIVRKNILFFFTMTIIYITLVDTFTAYDGKFAIVRTLIFGFATIGMLGLYQISDKEDIQMTNYFKRKWLIPVASFLAISMFFGAVVPKASPKWPDPFPFLEGYVQGEGSGGGGIGLGGISKIGYDEDDSQLGGPFIHDESLVFIGKSESEHYWRVETKDTYTGKGWELSQADNMVLHDGSSGSFLYAAEQEFLNENLSHAEVSFLGNQPHIIYAQGLDKIFFEEESTEFMVNTVNEKIYQSFFDSASTYFLTYYEPNFEINALKKVTNSSGVGGDFLNRYTQLPESLPERVHSLAVELTDGLTNWYEKARAIEDYLKGPNFTYDTKEVAVPGRTDDYVDQFLFETMIGYCDNFSTSMVVLLRSINIPARWVKGYNGGNHKLDGYFEITNNDAHSWVEVFFPSVGWVPFEPTKGFTNLTNFYLDIENDTSEEKPINQEESPEQSPQPTKPEMPEIEEEPVNSSTAKVNHSVFVNFINEQLTWIVSSVFLIILIGYLLFFFRRRWIPYYLILRYKITNDSKSFGKAYLALVKQLNRYGFDIEAGETLRHFANRVDMFFDSSDMGALTAQYERYLYRDDVVVAEGNAWKANWERLLKRTVAKQ